MYNSPLVSRTEIPEKPIQIEIWQRRDARFVASVRECLEKSHPRSSLLHAKRTALRQYSNVHVETFSENDAECTLEYSVLLAAANPDEAREELCCILLLLEAEAACLLPCVLSAQVR